jgi:hypothetical protein
MSAADQNKEIARRQPRRIENPGPKQAGSFNMAVLSVGVFRNGLACERSAQLVGLGLIFDGEQPVRGCRGRIHGFLGGSGFLTGALLIVAHIFVGHVRLSKSDPVPLLLAAVAKADEGCETIEPSRLPRSWNVLGQKF